jgi:glyoxylate/hydroxypyruvate reductase A
MAQGSGSAGKPNVLFMLPPGWDSLSKSLFGNTAFNAFLHGKDHYAPQQIDYFVGFRPPHGFLKTLPRLKAIFSLGAGVDGFLRDPDFPRHLPVVRFVDETLQREMAQFVTMHVLIVHRMAREFHAAQKAHDWKQRMLAKPTREVRVGILGLGDIGVVTAERLLMFDFQVSGWSRGRKDVPGVTSFAGPAELPQFLAGCDFLVCMLPLTPETEGILNAKLFAQLPRGAWLINVGRGGHQNEDDIVAALDSGQLGGAVLDVFQTEPLPADSPLWDHPRVTMTPHIAGITDPRNAADFVVECVERAETGQPFRNTVDLSKGY